ncbi:hypothetical protein P7F88_21620 [Vibrio hannami]|uniref:hypothetical protein n=1 Tax=Vibrio hannami TaxID=2717094 RepID=UPI0024102E0E|nr:hypothetical protein [Vibrio hannami]MDG3088521.1 hypothetical protein [Vibrio hannami]
MLSLTERLEQINKLRKQALSDPEFIQSARAHEQAIQGHQPHYSKSARKKQKQKTFADVYRESNFSVNPADSHH